jgi:hypothetical protein
LVLIQGSESSDRIQTEKGETVNRFSIALLLVVLATLTFAQETTTPVVAPVANPDLPQPSVWMWRGSSKTQFAFLKSADSDLLIDLTFFDGELGNFRVMIPNQSITPKTTGGAQKQREKNKLKVVFSFDGGSPFTKTWGVIQYPNSEEIAPHDDTDKEFMKTMRTQKFTISYVDSSGKTVTGTFIPGTIAEQMQEHKVHVHKFGFKDMLPYVQLAIPRG